MTSAQAANEANACMRAMAELYTRPVFDEWLIISLGGKKGAIIFYAGPRQEEVKDAFPGDVQSLVGELKGRKHEVGDFAFARRAEGTHFDAFLVLGKNLFLLCNNTELTMDDIAEDPLWLKAQAPFVHLSEMMRGDPLELPS
jgi:hypothetical protein